VPLDQLNAAVVDHLEKRLLDPERLEALMDQLLDRREDWVRPKTPKLHILQHPLAQRTDRGGSNRGVHRAFLRVQGTSQSHGYSASPKASQLRRAAAPSTPPAERVRPCPKVGRRCWLAIEPEHAAAFENDGRVAEWRQYGATGPFHRTDSNLSACVSASISVGMAVTGGGRRL
jgi:hypothetical protein